jgi:hypothetical protein
VPPERSSAPPNAGEAGSLGAAVQGFVDLVGWYTGLVGGQARKVADALDGLAHTGDDPVDTNAGAGRIDTDAGGHPARTRTDAVVGELARATALPVLGWALLLNEVFDAAAVIVDPPQPRRERTSDVFHGHADLAGCELVAVGPELPVEAGETSETGGAADATGAPRRLLNGFGERLPSDVVVEVVTHPLSGDTPPRLPVQLKVSNIPPECVGVYTGDVVAEDDPGGERIPVWIVVG